MSFDNNQNIRSISVGGSIIKNTAFCCAELPPLGMVAPWLLVWIQLLGWSQCSWIRTMIHILQNFIFSPSTLKLIYHHTTEISLKVALCQHTSSCSWHVHAINHDSSRSIIANCFNSQHVFRKWFRIFNFIYEHICFIWRPYCVTNGIQI